MYMSHTHIKSILTDMRNKILLTCILMSVLAACKPLLCHGMSLTVSSVRHMSNTDGLSSQRVYSIVEDRHHAIWISTKSGIDRYNGQHMSNYILSDGHNYGDLAARIIQLLYLPDGALLAYDNTGKVYQYSDVYDRFELKTQLSRYISGNITLNKYHITEDGKEFFGLTSGLYVKENNRVRKCIAGLDVNDIVSLGGTLYLGTTAGLKITDTSGRHVKGLLDGKSIQTLYYDRERNNLFIGTFNSGLWILSLGTGALTHVPTATDIFDNPIRSIIKYDSDTLIVGIDGSGIFTYSYSDMSIKRLIDSDDSGGDACLTSSGIYTTFKDSQRNLWIGSYTGGVSQVIFSKYPITFITHRHKERQSLVNDNVKSIAEGQDGSMWFATERGISVYSPANRTWRHLLPGKVCVSLCRGNGGEMAVGTYASGIFVTDSKGNVTRHLTRQTDNITSNYIFSIKKDTDGDYWVGSIDGDLMHLDSRWRLRRTYAVKQIFSFETLGEGRIAAATSDGFYIIDKRTGRIGHFASAKEQMSKNVSAYIISMLFNNDHTVWLGTEGGGILLYDFLKRKIKKHITSNDGLPSNDIFGLKRDSEGRIWISTGNGIAVMNGGEIWNLNYISRISQEYNKASCVMTASGRILFGSTNGAVELNPSEITRVDYDAPLRITKFDVDVPYSNDPEFMSSVFNMLASEKIRLTHSQNSFDINFESINLRYQNDIVYRFILEGYDKGWSDAGRAQSARYKNVTPGSYTFRVCSMSKSTGKVIDEKTVGLTILPPWWMSWWAWLCYIIILVLIGYFATRYKLYQMQKRHYDDKINFFVNTSHDIRTPITLVMAPLEDLLNETDLPDKARYLLGLANTNIRKLYSLTSQLLEFEKIGRNLNRTRLVPVNLCEMLTEEAACFQAVCDRKGLSMSLSLPEDEVCVKATQRMLEIIFDNLISNACKYTGNGGSIRISMTADNKKATVRIEDTGIGIPQNEHKHIFSDIHRARNAYESQEHGLGFGLLQVQRVVSFLNGKIRFSSKEGVGTTFTVTLDRTFARAVPGSRQSSFDNILDEVLPSDIPAYDGYGDNGETILVVEDNDDLRHYLCKTLSADYRVVEKPNAAEALAYMETAYPDLIISDVMMPGMQGDDFCNIVKEKPETSGIPIILLTAKTTHEAVVEGLRKGADDYLTKPFSTEILKLKIKGMIENRRRMRDCLLRHAVRKTDATGSMDKDRSQGAASTEDGEANVMSLSENDRMFVEKATDIVLDNISNTDFSIDALCREMAMSRTLFYSRLKSLTGRAPQEFIRIIRLERAAELLKNGGSVVDVSEATGFINVKYFSTVFKKYFGIQPSRYAEETD